MSTQQVDIAKDNRVRGGLERASAGGGRIANDEDTEGTWAIDLQNVTKRYAGKKGGILALRGIEMRVKKGEIFGLLGPNGAGKSTLVKILMTVIAPTTAQGSVLGAPVGDKPTLGRIGYLPEHHRFPDYLTGAQVLEFYGALGGVERRERKKRAGELLELVDMSRWATTRVKGYSKGMRQRIGIAQALMNNPELVVLDEPTDGVDPVGRRDIRAMLTRLKERGMTVFLNSHLLSELEMVCDRVAILVKGKVYSQGTIAELTEHRKYYEIEIESSGAEASRDTYMRALSTVVKPGSGAPETATMVLAQMPGKRIATLGTGELVVVDQGVLRVATVRAETVQPIIDALRAHGAVIKTVRSVKPSLEDLFMEAVIDPMTGEALTPGAAESVKGVSSGNGGLTS